jgi:predicted hydrocarbon binding protein
MACDREKHSRPHCEGNVVVEVKAPADAEAFAKAQTPDEKRVAYCHCPLARAAKRPLPRPYCCCGGGWYRGIWEFIIEKPVRAELIKSVMSGDEHCAFAVHLPAGAVGGKENS